MSGDLFRITAEKILTLMCFLAIGYYLAKKKLVQESAPNVLSKLLTMFFCPALTFYSMASNLSRKSIAANGNLLITSIVLMLVSIVIVRFISPVLARGDDDLRRILDYNLIISNYGYIGYPMIQGVFGDAALSRYLLYAMPISMVCYTYGRIVLEGGKRLSLKFLLAPLSLSLWLGLLFGVAEIKLPNVVADMLSSAGDCMGPIAMLVTGMTLSKVNILGCLRDKSNYLFVALRLVVLPLVALAIMYPLGVRGEALFFTGCSLCFPFGSNPIVFREAAGLDTQKAMGMTLLSYVFALVTVPLMFALFRSLSGLL